MSLNLKYSLLNSNILNIAILYTLDIIDINLKFEDLVFAKMARFVTFLYVFLDLY